MNHESHPDAGENRGKQTGRNGIQRRFLGGTDAASQGDYRIITGKTEAGTPQPTDRTDVTEPKSPLSRAEQRRYGRELTGFQQILEEKMLTHTDDSTHQPYFEGDSPSPLTVHKDNGKGELAGFRQSASYTIPTDKINTFPLEGEKSNGRGFMLDAIRGKEKDAPITRVTLLSFTMPNGEQGGVSERILEADFKTGDIQYYFCKAAGGEGKTVRRGDARMKDVLSFWTDQIESATVIPPQIRHQEPQQRRPRIRNVFRHK